MVIKTDLHTHTLASSHAYSTVRENAILASEHGLEAMALTDHAPAMADAPHEWHFACMNLIPRKINGVFVLRGAECSYTDIDAGLDLSVETLNKLDIVIASVHGPIYAPKNPDEYFTLLNNAVKNPHIDILGHIDRVVCGVDFESTVKLAKENCKLVEFNTHSLNYSNAKRTIQNTHKLIEACKKYSVPIVVNTDAHYCEAVGAFDEAVQFLKESDFDENLIINTTFEKLKSYMIEKRSKTAWNNFSLN